MGTAGRLLDDSVDDSERPQIVRPHLQGPGRLGLMLGAFPEDPGAALRADDAVVGMLEDGHPVADANPKRPPRASLADDHADDRDRESRHEEHALGDHLGLAAFLGADAGISAGGVDEADHRQAVLRRQPHLAHRLAVALGMGAAEVARLTLGERFSFLVADDEHLVAVELRKPGQHCRVVTEGPVAVELDELVEDERDVVARLRPVGVAGDLDGLPGIEAAEDPLLDLDKLTLQPSELLLLEGAERRGLQSGDPVLDLVDRLLEGKPVQAAGHGALRARRWEQGGGGGTKKALSESFPWPRGRSQFELTLASSAAGPKRRRLTRRPDPARRTAPASIGGRSPPSRRGGRRASSPSSAG